MPKTVTLQFHPSSEPPDDDRIVLCSDGEFVMAGWFNAQKNSWFWLDGNDWPEVQAWADLPKDGYV